MNQHQRTEKLIGKENREKLKACRVAVFGTGGVGGFAAEALARAGVGTIDIIDRDKVDITNLNRQIIALHSTVGKSKVSVMKERILDINPQCHVNAIEKFFLPETAGEFDFTQYDYVIDAVDTVTAKLEIISICSRDNIPVISSMGTGNKLHPEMLQIADIYDTKICPLAKVMRKELKKRGIKSLKCVYSQEEPVKTGDRTPASISFTPPVAGMLMAGEVIRNLLELK